MSRNRNRTRPKTWLLVTIALGGIVTAALTLPSRTEPGEPVPVRAAAERPSKATPIPSACPAVVAAMPAHRRLAQLLVVGVNAADATAAVNVVSSEQIGGIFLGGNAT
jgi:beta-N-acetylhexosaminidase